MLSSAETGATVLVVEDYDDTRLLLRMMLEMRGYQVVEAENGRQAVEVAAKENPQLILMDLNLPLLNGFEATREIHSQPAMRNVPVVAVSAQCAGEYRQRALDLVITHIFKLLNCGNERLEN
ncbi:MAG: response regulator [Pyrinomonadaceae bacterium]